MGVSNLLGMTAFYIVKYLVYIAIVIAAIFTGKAWASHSKNKKQILNSSRKSHFDFVGMAFSLGFFVDKQVE